MNELKELRERLFKTGQTSEQEEIYLLCEVMQICGGYEQLMNLPLPALKQILKYLEWKENETRKRMPKIPKGRKR